MPSRKRPVAAPGRRPVLRRRWWAALLAAATLTACWAAPLALADPSPSASPSTAPDADQDGEPGLTPAAGAAAGEDADRQAQLVQGENDRLIDVRIAGKTRVVTYPLRPYRVRSAGLYTLVLPARRAAYTLDDLRRLAPQTFLLQPDGSFLLREHILVDTGATLALSPQRPTTIKLLSAANGFVSIISRGGRLRLLGSAAAPLTFTSWDDTANTPDTTLRDGRAYLLADGQLIVRHTKFSALGFWSGRTGGLALAGSGAPTAGKDLAKDAAPADTATSSTHRQTQVLEAGALPTTTTDNDTIAGEISDTELNGNAFGLFLTGAAGVSVHNVVIRSSLVHGLVLHRSVTSARVDQVRVEGSAADGIVVTRGVQGATFSQVTSSRNGQDGVVITGTPLATGPSPSGGSVHQFGNNVLTASVVEDNARAGVRINGGSNVRVMGNSIRGGHQGVLVSHGAEKVVVEANRVVGATANGIQVRQAHGVEITGNSIRQSPTGVHVLDAAVTLQDNTIASATLHAVSLVGRVDGSTIAGNTLSGSGSSAVDLSRVTGGEPPDVSRNDLGGWQRVITKDGVLSTLMHPLTLIWLTIGLVFVGVRPAVHRKRKQPAIAYVEKPATSQTTLNVSEDQQIAIEAVLAEERSREQGRQPQPQRQPQPAYAAPHPGRQPQHPQPQHHQPQQPQPQHPQPQRLHPQPHHPEPHYAQWTPAPATQQLPAHPAPVPMPVPTPRAIPVRPSLYPASQGTSYDVPGALPGAPGAAGAPTARRDGEPYPGRRSSARRRPASSGAASPYDTGAAANGEPGPNGHAAESDTAGWLRQMGVG